MPKSSSTFDAALFLELLPAGRLRALLVAGYLAAGAGLLAVPWPIAMAAACLLLAGATRDLARAGRRDELAWHADGTWTRGADAPDRRLRLGPRTYVSRWLVVLELVDPDGDRTWIPVTRERIDPVTWRRLRARLQVRGPALVAPGEGEGRAQGVAP